MEPVWRIDVADPNIYPVRSLTTQYKESNLVFIERRLTPKVKPVPTPQTQTVAARSKDGTGEAIALITPDDGIAPWMKYAVAEAKRHKGAKEADIEKNVNYATEVRTGQQTMVGDKHPWCAAFVNWCLMKAGYPVDNTDFHDHTAAKGRAHGFYEVKGKKLNPKDKDAPKVRNPLFIQIEKPVYGAIAMVTNRGGHGHHVGFVYANANDGHVVLLGGNQSDQINFAENNIEPIPPKKIKDREGKTQTIAGKPDRLIFFVPSIYFETAKKQITEKQLTTERAPTLNNNFGISQIQKKGNATR